MSNLIVSAAQCPKCLEIIVSGSHHDYHRCSCGEIAIDGGREYVRLSFRKTRPDVFDLKCVNILVQDFHEDVNAQSRALHHNREYPTNPQPIPRRKLTTIRTKNVVQPDKFRYTINENGKFYRYVKLA